MMRTVGVLACLVGCAHAPARVALASGEVLDHLDDLARDGTANLETIVVAESGARTAGATETVFLDTTVRYAGASTRISALVLGCGTFTSPGAPPCRFAPKSADLFVLRTIDKAPPSDADDKNTVARVTGFLSLGLLAGMGACIGLCEEHKVGYSAGLGGAALLTLVIYAIATGAHD